MAVYERVSIGSLAQGAVPPGYTFTRSTAALYVDSDGLLKDGPNNMALYSQDFANGGWNKRGTTTVTSNSATAPDGTATADRINDLGAGSGTSQGLDSNFALGKTGTITVSFYIKRSSTSGTLKLYNIADNTRGEWSIDMALLSDSWERVTAAHAAVTVVIPFTASVSSTGGFQWKASSGTLDFDLWGAQISVGSQLFDYLPTTSAPNYGPRRQWDATNRRWGYVGEPSRKNEMLRSQEFDSASWNKRGTCIITADSSVAPDGTTTADLVSGLNSGSNDLYQTAPATLTASARYEPSFFIKRVSTSGTLLVDNPAGGASGSWSVDMALLPDDWVRVTRTHAAVTITTEHSATVGGVGGLHFRKTVAGVLSFYLWGAQLEAGSYPTSYIPTTTVAVSRGADLLTRALTAGEGTALSDHGSMVVEFSYLGKVPSTSDADRYAICLDDASTNNRQWIGGSGTADRVYHVTKTSGSTVAAPTATVALSVGLVIKAASRFATNDVNVSANTAIGTVDTTAAMPTLTQIVIGAGHASAGPLCGLIYGWTIYDDAKTDAELQALSSPTVSRNSGSLRLGLGLGL